jgi:hypothetical protein
LAWRWHAPVFSVLPDSPCDNAIGGFLEIPESIEQLRVADHIDQIALDGYGLLAVNAFDCAIVKNA